MGSEGRETVRSPQAEHHCPACGQPVGTVVKRRKTLGAFVPTWGPGPCHNPSCPECAEGVRETGAEHRGAAAGAPTGVQPEHPGDGPGGGSGEASGSGSGTAVGAA
ncbi:hypothetical protein [Streptomyces sp. NBC_00829]|uniref:hypothetical protein n=1 Tax=Streptomyces sp. NBC_00829 TaxID=2903679 RepID=UPI00386C3018|nr:hypothetical protein OG293_10855 [Streptomyces sp. NBC_00829]